MSTLEENVQKVENAFAETKTALAGKGVTVSDGAKLSDVPALVESCGKKLICTFEFTNTDGAKTVETTSEGVVSLVYRCYLRLSATSISVEADSSAVFGTDASSMFSGCSFLASLTLPAGFGAKITDASSMFYGCTSLTQILAPEGVVLADDGSNGILRMKVGFDLSPTKLDKDSLVRVVKSLQTVASAKLVLGTTLKAKLEGDDNADGAAALALAALKGWTIA